MLAREKIQRVLDHRARCRLLITGIRSVPTTRAAKWRSERIQDELRDWRINRQIKRGNSPGGDRTKEKRQGGCRWWGGLSEEGRRVRWREGGKLSLRATRQYFHFALIILFSFSSVSLSCLLFFPLLFSSTYLLSLPISHSRSSSSQSELAARQMKIYRSPCPVGGFNLICHSVVAETTKGRDSRWTLLLVKPTASTFIFPRGGWLIRGF